MKIGLTLPNRGVLFGVTTAEEMLRMAEIADASGLVAGALPRGGAPFRAQRVPWQAMISEAR